MASASAAGPHQASGRLPPNPRRHKVQPDLRKRVASACTPCNIRRLKCSGNQPCLACQRSSRDCQYPRPTERVTASREAIRALQRENAILENCLKDAVPSDRERRELKNRWSHSESRESDSPEASREADSQDRGDGDNSPLEEGAILKFSDGYARFMGGSSGAVFMDHLRSFINNVLPMLPSSTPLSAGIKPEESFTSLLGQYHTYDSRPITLPQVDALYLPPMNEIFGLLDVFSSYVEDKNVTSSCGGIYYWGGLRDILIQAQNAAAETSPESLALLNSSLAVACQFDIFAAQDSETNPGETFFSRARLLLSNPLENASLTTMHTLAFMAYYLLGSGRRDTAFMYIGTAIRVAIAHGLHQGQMHGEQRKRQFWNMFILDRSLSCLMGRPSNIPDEVISLGMPTDTTDGDHPPAAGLLAHVRLSMIMGEITSKVYGKDRGTLRILSHIDDVISKLSEWVESLPSSMQLIDGSPAHEDSNKLTLHMMRNQLLILSTRPLLFYTVKANILSHFSPTAPKPPGPFSSTEHANKYISTCISAARENVHLIRKLVSSNRATMLLSLNHHYSFNAAIALELSYLLCDHARDEDLDNVDFLRQHLDVMAQSGSGNESAYDCSRMVTEFKAIVQKLRKLTVATTTKGSSSASSKIESVSIPTPIDSNIALVSIGSRGSTSQPPRNNGDHIRGAPSPSEQGNAYHNFMSFLKDDLLPVEGQHGPAEAQTGGLTTY